MNERKHAMVQWEENHIVYDIGLQMTYKNTLCVKLSMHLLSCVNVHFAFRSFQRNYDLYFGMNK